MNTAATKILIVEDDDLLGSLLSEYLDAQGFDIALATNGNDGAKRILESKPDLVVLDLMIPGIDGLEVLRRVRDEFHGAIMMLTASQSESDHVAGLELGADDFVTKPIEPRVLLARIRTQLRRRSHSTQEESSQAQIAGMIVDPASREVRLDGEDIGLTAMEFDVLWMLVTQAGTVVERDRLYEDVLGTTYDGLDRGLDVHISRIRRKLETHGFDAKRLKSVRGVGYLLVQR